MAEQAVFPDSAGQRGLEGVDVVDALAGKGAFAEQVLIHIGHGCSVGVHAAGTGKHLLVQRAFALQRQ